MNRLLLWLAARLSGPLARCGIDPDQFRLLLTLKFDLDARRPVSFLQGARADKSRSGRVMVYVMMLFFGAMIAVSTVHAPPLLGQALLQGFVMTMLAMTLLAEFNTVIHDPADDAILRPRPIGERTLLAVRFAHAGSYVAMHALCLGGPALLLGFWWQRPLYFPAYALALALNVLLTLTFVYVVYLGAMRLFDARRFREVINYIQVVMSIVFSLSYIVLPRLMEGLLAARGGIVADATRAAVFLPPVWLAAWPARTLGDDTVGLGLLALGLVVPLCGLVLVFGVLAPAYRRRLAADAGSTRGPTRRRAGPRFMRRATPRSAAYRLVAALMARDRAFRLRVYPGMVTLAVVLCANMFLFRARGVSLAQHLRTGPGYVMLLYAAVFIASTVVFEWAKSESASAAWILSALPVPRAGDLLAGALLALTLRVVLPCFGLAAALTLYFWGAEHATDVVVAAAVAPLVLAVFVILGGRRIPFSAPITQESERRPVAALLAMIVVAIAGGSHYVLALFYPRVLWALAAVALALGCVAITTIVRRPWVVS